jgi:cohesin loading factor subunit SCC2
MKTVHGFGFLFHQHPRWFLKAHQDGILSSILLDPVPEVRHQILTSLVELLQAEEARLESIQKIDEKVKEQVQGDQEGDASLIGGVMQAQLKTILKLAIQKQASIRLQAMSCIGLLLTQGLVSPLECIPTLVALLCDNVPVIRDAAYRHIAALHEKSPNIANTPAIQGIFQSFNFQLRAFNGQWNVMNSASNDHVECFFGLLYRKCMQHQRLQRFNFFNALLNVFREKGPVFVSIQKNELKTEKGLSYLAYVASILATLPYDVEEEPLYIVYTINRDVSLHLEYVLYEYIYIVYCIRPFFM